jgi:hypothetical protein
MPRFPWLEDFEGEWSFTCAGYLIQADESGRSLADLELAEGKDGPSWSIHRYGQRVNETVDSGIADSLAEAQDDAEEALSALILGDGVVQAIAGLAPIRPATPTLSSLVEAEMKIAQLESERGALVAVKPINYEVIEELARVLLRLSNREDGQDHWFTVAVKTAKVLSKCGRLKIEEISLDGSMCRYAWIGGLPNLKA